MRLFLGINAVTRETTRDLAYRTCCRSFSPPSLKVSNLNCLASARIPNFSKVSPLSGGARNPLNQLKSRGALGAGSA